MQHKWESSNQLKNEQYGHIFAHLIQQTHCSIKVCLGGFNLKQDQITGSPQMCEKTCFKTSTAAHLVLSHLRTITDGTVDDAVNMASASSTWTPQEPTPGSCLRISLASLPAEGARLPPVGGSNVFCLRLGWHFLWLLDHQDRFPNRTGSPLLVFPVPQQPNLQPPVYQAPSVCRWYHPNHLGRKCRDNNLELRRQWTTLWKPSSCRT